MQPEHLVYKIEEYLNKKFFIEKTSNKKCFISETQKNKEGCSNDKEQPKTE